MATKTNLQKLQAEAKSLGIEGFDLLTESELSAKIEEFKANSAPDDEETVEEEIKAPVKVAPKKTTEDLNVALVKDKNGKDVRRYTLDIHGKDFVALAEEFADKNGYEIVMVKDREYIVCPGCGRKIYK